LLQCFAQQKKTWIVGFLVVHLLAHLIFVLDRIVVRAMVIVVDGVFNPVGSAGIVAVVAINAILGRRRRPHVSLPAAGQSQHPGRSSRTPFFPMISLRAVATESVAAGGATAAENSAAAAEAAASNSRNQQQA
jgi:hypothetical protein